MANDAREEAEAKGISRPEGGESEASVIETPATRDEQTGLSAGRTKKSRKGVKLGRRTVNKSEQIRTVAKMLIAEGKPPRPIEIVEFLKAKGITVTSGQVSLALKGSSLALRPSGPGGTPSRVYLPDPIEALRRIRLEDLGEAKKFISRMGGIEKALTAIVAASQVGQPDEDL
jgi:hypothetical protein